MAGWIRSETAALDPTVPVTIGTMQQRMQSVSERPRFSAALLSFFALVGLIIAAGGLYGLTSFLVAQRSAELGLRLALGATSRQILTLVLAHALRRTVFGIVLGLAGAILAARSLRALLFQAPPENLKFFGAAAFLMIVVAATAALVPSVRASQIDPAIALRHD